MHPGHENISDKTLKFSDRISMVSLAISSTSSLSSALSCNIRELSIKFKSLDYQAVNFLGRNIKTPIVNSFASDRLCQNIRKFLLPWGLGTRWYLRVSTNTDRSIGLCSFVLYKTIYIINRQYFNKEVWVTDVLQLKHKTPTQTKAVLIPH